MRNRIYYYDKNDGRLLKNTKTYLGDKSFEVDTVDWNSVKSIFILLGTTCLISIVILLLECHFFQILATDNE